MKIGSVLHPISALLRSALTVMAIGMVVSLSAAPLALLTAQEATPELTAEVTPEPTSTPLETLTPTDTATAMATATETQSPPSPTWTPVVQTVVVPATVQVLATIIVPATVEIPVIVPATALPLPTMPPVQPAPVMTATHTYGWTRHESIELIQMIGSWALVRDRSASDGAYHESASAGATLRFPFTGDGLRLIYRAQPQGGRFAVVLDGVVQGVYDTQADEAGFYFAGPFFFSAGYHVVDVVALAERSGQSAIAIDALEVFNGPPLPTSPAAAAPDTAAADERREVASSVQIDQSPPVPPSATAIPEALVSIDILIAYDLNRNRSADADEGVQGLSVRLLDGGDNRLLASGLTDERGYVRLQALTRSSVTAVVPYLGESYTVRAGRGRAQSARWTLLLEAGTQPGLIP